MAQCTLLALIIVLISITTAIAQPLQVNLNANVLNIAPIEINPEDCLNFVPNLVTNAQFFLNLLKEKPQDRNQLVSIVLGGGDIFNLGINKCISKVTNPIMQKCITKAVTVGISLILDPQCPMITAEIVAVKFEEVRQDCPLLPPLPPPVQSP